MEFIRVNWRHSGGNMRIEIRFHSAPVSNKHSKDTSRVTVQRKIYG